MTYRTEVPRPVTRASIPARCLLSAGLARADFADAWSAPLTDASLSPTSLFIRSCMATPAWVEWLMSIRNGVVQRLGLKSVGALQGRGFRDPASYRVGDQLGIFGILAMADNELLLGIDDRHLDVRVSVCTAPAEVPRGYVVSTSVTVHNWLGHLYMLPVGRIHPLVVRAMMRRTQA